jgi:hypothetical protein
MKASRIARPQPLSGVGNAPEFGALTTTLSLLAGIHVTCVRGQLHIPLYSAEERAQTLPSRLQHFVLVARGEAIPAISVPKMVSLSEWMKLM